jgi:hypothetical protein
VPESDRVGEGDIEPRGAGNGRRNLRHLERVGEARPLVVVGRDEDLRLAGETPEGRRVKNAIAIPLETGPHRIGILLDAPRAGAEGASGSGSEETGLQLLALLTTQGQAGLELA